MSVPREGPRDMAGELAFVFDYKDAHAGGR
jgi:hypothetical protein